MQKEEETELEGAEGIWQIELGFMRRRIPMVEKQPNRTRARKIKT